MAPSRESPQSTSVPPLHYRNDLTPVDAIVREVTENQADTVVVGAQYHYLQQLREAFTAKVNIIVVQS